MAFLRPSIARGFNTSSFTRVPSSVSQQPLLSYSSRHLATAATTRTQLRTAAWNSQACLHQPNSSRHFTTTITRRMDKDSANKESAKGPEEWKERAPYSIHNDNEKFGALYEASCHCGKVSYQLNRKEPLDSKLCHCTTCQTQHAAPFQWAAIFHKEDINFTNGHQNLEWYDPSTKSIEHKLPCKVRCSFCHSPIMDEGRSMILLFPSLIHFPDNESKLNFKPRCHMFYGQRVMDIPDGLPKWTGLDKADDSELIEDSPPELVREYERKREDTRNEKKRKVEEEGGGANQAEKK